MGEHAHDAMRQEIKNRHGYDIGEYEDEPVKKYKKPIVIRVKCPYCDATPKEKGFTESY